MLWVQKHVSSFFLQGALHILTFVVLPCTYLPRALGVLHGAVGTNMVGRVSCLLGLVTLLPFLESSLNCCLDSCSECHPRWFVVLLHLLQQFSTRTKLCAPYNQNMWRSITPTFIYNTTLVNKAMDDAALNFPC